MTEIENSPFSIIILIIELGKNHQWMTRSNQRYPIQADYGGTPYLALCITKVL